MRKSLLFIILGTIIVLSFTFATYFVLIKFHPEDEVRRMLFAMSRLKTVNESGGFSWTMSGNGPVARTTLYTSGQINLEDLTRLEHDTKFRSVFLGQTNQYTDLSGEWKVIDDKTFLTYAPPGPNVKGVSFAQDGTWVSFEPGEFLSWGSIVPGMVLPIATSKDHVLWSPESLKQLRMLIARADVFSVVFNGKLETIQNHQTRVIDARLDPDATKSFLFNVLRARDTREPSDDDRLLVDAQATALSHLSVRMWIGAQDHLLYRIELNGNMAQTNRDAKIPVDVRVEFFDFNKPFVATSPNVSQPFTTIFQNAFGSLPLNKFLVGDGLDRPVSSQREMLTQGVQLQVQQIQTAEDPDHDGLDNILETFYGTNPNKADTDGDGVNDGEEVRRGTNPRGKGSLFGFGLGK